MYYAHKLDEEAIAKIKKLPRDTDLSFDGVHRSVYENFDVLVGRPVTLFVIGGFLGSWYIKTHPNYCSEEQLRWMKGMGAVLGWHSRSHRISLDDCDLDRPKWCDPVFAYPFGIFSPTAIEKVKRAGFLRAYATENGNDQKYTLRRNPL